MIRLEKISKNYQFKGSTLRALDNVSLQVKGGEIFGVVGQSGAGKSTLIRCVNLLERPSAGQVFINGLNLLDLSQEQLLIQRRKMGMIFQHFNLLANRTIAENVALPLKLAGHRKAFIVKRVAELLALTGLGDRSGHYPSQLSGGQKQRVAIARALANEPNILLSDEATSALDPKTTEDILQLLQRINRELGLTILLITHEMDVVKSICQGVALLEGGQLVESGAVEEFFMNPQTELGRRFVAQSQRLPLPASYERRLVELGNPLVQLRFAGAAVDEPLLSTLTRRFDVDVNIIQAKIEGIGSGTLGLLQAEIRGPRSGEALEHLQSLKLKMEILGYVE